MYFARHYIYLLASFVVLLVGCNDHGVGPTENSGVEYALPISYNGGIGSGQTIYLEWTANRLFATWPLRYYELDRGFKLRHDSVLFAYTELNTWPPIPDSVIHDLDFIRANAEGTLILGVAREGILSRSDGPLVEISTKDWKRIELIHKRYHVSSAYYLSQDSVLFYSRGIGDLGISSGYYILHRTTKEISLYFPYFANEKEIVNGFDFCKSTGSLAIPVRTETVPYILEVNVTAGKIDTLRVPFTPEKQGWDLHVRYSKNGQKLLYSVYDPGSLRGPAIYPTEIGILNISSEPYVQRLTRPTVPDSVSLAFCPVWSPDEKHIAFAASRIAYEPPGAREVFRPVILSLP